MFYHEKKSKSSPRKLLPYRSVFPSAMVTQNPHSRTPPWCPTYATDAFPKFQKQVLAAG